MPKWPKRPRRKCRAPKHDVLRARLSRRLRSSGRLVRTRCEVWPRARICSRSRRRNRLTSPSGRRLGRPRESAFPSETQAHLRVSGRVCAVISRLPALRPARSAVDFGPKLENVAFGLFRHPAKRIMAAEPGADRDNNWSHAIFGRPCLLSARVARRRRSHSTQRPVSAVSKTKLGLGR